MKYSVYGMEMLINLRKVIGIIKKFAPPAVERESLSRYSNLLSAVFPGKETYSTSYLAFGYECGSCRIFKAF